MFQNIPSIILFTLITFIILKQEKRENAAGKSSYELIDRQPLMGTNYYRLQAVDKDGKWMYSEVIVMDVSAFSEFKVWMDTEVRLSFDSQNAMDNDVQIMDLKGRLVFQQTLTSVVGQNEWRLPFLNTNSGIYILKISNRYGEKVVKLFLK